MGYCALATYALLRIVDRTIGLRVPPDAERDGLDLAVHGESIL
jgi:Amt family ammonium transporter